MIANVKIKQLRVICDERGSLMEMLRRDDELFKGFGQVYMTSAYPRSIKTKEYLDYYKKQYAQA